MNLFDIKIKKKEISEEDGSLYLEFVPKNEELENLIMHAELINDYSDIEITILNMTNSARNILFNSLPEEIQEKYINAQFKINNSIENPSNVDYNIIGLHKKRAIIKGELVQVDYFRNFNPVSNEYSDLIIREERIFSRNEIGLVQYRELNISWYLNNDDIGCSKNTVKYYSPTESIDEGKIRRANIISEAKIYMLMSVGQINGFIVLNELKTQIELYIDGFKQPLIDGVYNLDKPFLTEQNKNNIVEILTF